MQVHPMLKVHVRSEGIMHLTFHVNDKRANDMVQTTVGFGPLATITF